MAIQFRPAIRSNVNLLIGLAGTSGSGKTYSALRLATGMAQGRRFALIDTENGRALHYADQFPLFDHCDLHAPFTPDRYAEAILAADAAGYPVIVVDSMSHEWAGEGGVLEWHETELTRMAGDDWKRREACTMAAWIRPKQNHRMLVQKLLQTKAHVIFCFRAEAKVEIAKDDKGKTIIRPKTSTIGLDGIMPISEKNLPYELTVSLLMTADAPGVPKPIKLQEQHRKLFPLEKAITEDSGMGVAAWAAGGSKAAEPVQGPTHAVGEYLDPMPLFDAIRNATTGSALREISDRIAKLRLLDQDRINLREAGRQRVETLRIERGAA